MNETDERPIRVLARIVHEQTECHAAGGKVIDTHFIPVGITEAAADREGFTQALDAALADHGEFCDVSAARLREGPSYIELGGWLGDQSLALRFMALAEFQGRGKVITPAILGLTGEDAEKAAGNGYVLLAPPQKAT